jgi:hypothetical protein
MKKLLLGLCIAVCIFGCESKEQGKSRPENTPVKTDMVSSINTENSASTSEDHSLKLTQLTSATGLELPPNTKIEWYESIEGSDQLIRSILIMPENDFQVWISTYSLDQESFLEEKRYLLGQNENNWNPQSPTQLPTAQVQFNNATAMNIGYLTEAESRIRIYLVFHGH